MPTSTRAWLSSTRRSASESARRADVHGAAREHQVPVGVAHVRRGLRDGGPHAQFGGLARDDRDLQLLPRVVDLEPANQRLGERRVEERRIARVEVGARVAGEGAGVVPADGECAAAPGERLGDAEVIGRGVRFHARGAAGQRAGGGDGLVALSQRGRQRRTEDVAEAFHGQVSRQRFELRHLDIEVLVEGQLDAVLERHLAQAAWRLTSGGRLRVTSRGRLPGALHRIVVRTHGVADDAVRTRGVLRSWSLGGESGGGGHTKHSHEANNLPHIPFRTNGRVSAPDFHDAVGWNLCAVHGPTAREAPSV